MIWLNVLHMNPVWSLVVLAAASLEYLMPELSRPGVAFSVTVAPQFRCSVRHATIVRYYRRGVLFSAFAGLMIAFGAAGPLIGWAGPAAFCTQYLLFLLAFLLARRATMPSRIAAPETREADLSRREPPAVLAVLVIAPLLTMAAVLFWTYSNWQQIPDPYPIHWGFDGQPDLWVERTPMHVYGVLGLLGGLAAMLAFFGYGFLFWARRNVGSEHTRYSFPAVWIALFLGAEYFVAASATLPLGLDIRPLELIVLAILAASSLYLIVIGPVGAHAARRPDDRTPDEAWKFGMFYFNPHDAALFVEKRFGLGWTINFGQTRAWVLIAMALAPLGVGFAFVMSIAS
ncbi:MAG: DUF5808 domain-containing protein [Candidatus Binataceae bacterium]